MHNLLEKRQHKRRDSNISISLESLQIGVKKNSRIVNRSDNGLYFESNQFFEPGSDIFIRIEELTDDETEPYECHHARVIWGKRLSNRSHSYGYGVKYVELADDEDSPDEGSGQKKELRRHPRMSCGKLATLGDENKTYTGFISNISRNGCFIENVEFLNVRQTLELDITGSKFSEDNVLKVEVVRLSPIGVGVKFKSIRRKNP
jgi:Tfp pilus assembly protein PilZ